MGKKSSLLLFTFLILGVLLRLLYLFQYKSSPLFDFPLGADVSEYYDWAMKIRAGSFLWDELNIHSPAYPFFLASLLEIFSDNFFLIRFFQSLFFLISGLALFYFLFIRNAENCEIRKGLIASFIFSIYPPLIYLSSEFYSESLLIPLLCWLVIFEDFAISAESIKGKLLFSGIFAFLSALALLTHPLSILFLLINFFYFFYSLKEKSMKIALQNSIIVFAIFAIILAPISLYNGVHFNKFFPFQANSGFNFYLGNNPDANGTCMIRPGAEWNRIHAKAKLDAEKNNVSIDVYFIINSFKFIVKNPFHYIALSLKKTLLVWNKTELISGADLTEFRYYTPFQRYTSWSFAILGTMSLSVLTTFFFKGEKFQRSEKILLILLFSFWIAQVITVTSSRYRSPMLLSQIFLASLYISELRKFFNKENIFYSLLALFISVMVVLFFPAPKFKYENAEAYTILAHSYLEKDEISEAKRLILESIRINPTSSDYNFLGTIYRSEGDYKKAKESYLKALNFPDIDKSTYMNLAIICDEMGEKEEAESYWKKALKNDKNSGVFYNYSVKLKREGKIDEALEYCLKALKINPYNTHALNNTGIIYMEKNQLQKAIPYLSKAYKFSSPHRKIYMGFNYAMCLSEMGNIEKAIQIAEEISKYATTELLKEKFKELKKNISDSSQRQKK